MMKTDTLHDLYVMSLQDLYSAETQLVDALPKVIGAIDDSHLKKAVQDHLGVTKEHVKRLETIFETLDYQPGGHTCQAMKGLLKEGDEVISEVKTPTILDAALIGAAQRIEHYEMAGYGTACAFAEELGYDDHCQLLKTTLEEEKQADEGLNKLALSRVNPAAARADEPVGAKTK